MHTANKAQVLEAVKSREGLGDVGEKGTTDHRLWHSELLQQCDPIADCLNRTLESSMATSLERETAASSILKTSA
jgi:hypothetical protein